MQPQKSRFLGLFFCYNNENLKRVELFLTKLILKK